MPFSRVNTVTFETKLKSILCQSLALRNDDNDEELNNEVFQEMLRIMRDVANESEKMLEMKLKELITNTISHSIYNVEKINNSYYNTRVGNEDTETLSFRDSVKEIHQSSEKVGLKIPIYQYQLLQNMIRGDEKTINDNTFLKLTLKKLPKKQSLLLSSHSSSNIIDNSNNINNNDNNSNQYRNICTRVYVK